MLDENIYKMTVTEKKLFEVMIEPENFKLNKTNLALKAGISRPTLNKILANENFIAEVNSLVSEMMFDNLFKVYLTLFNSATVEGREGFSDRKLLLDIMGQHQESLELKNTSPQIVFDIKHSDIKQEKEDFNTRYHTEGDKF